jgi:ATPase family protein associated with various cellular activities (AAA)
MTAAFRLIQPPCQHKLSLSDPGKPPQSLSERHRPKVLADVVGQGPVLFRVEAFLEAPYSTAFLFEGPTGVGKTTVALAIAAELGAVEMGGLEQVKSGMQDAEEVERVLGNLRYTPMLGSGWRVIIVDEADYMSYKASQIWLSALEDLPSRSLVIFTTNNTHKFSDRFLDRCERFAFESAPVMHAQDAQALIDRIWLAETGETESPRLADLPGVIDPAQGLSYRRVVRALEPLLFTRGCQHAGLVARSLPQAKPQPKAKPQPPPQRQDPQSGPQGADAPLAPVGEIDWQAAGMRWFAGESQRAIAESLGVKLSTLDRMTTKLGFTKQAKREYRGA